MDEARRGDLDLLVRTVQDEEGKYGRYLALVWRPIDGAALQSSLLARFGEEVAHPTDDCPHAPTPADETVCRYCGMDGLALEEAE
jgi:hypothetical protein